MSKNRMAVMAPALEFAFSNNISAENSKFSADSGIHGIQFLECMDIYSHIYPSFFTDSTALHRERRFIAQQKLSTKQPMAIFQDFDITIITLKMMWVNFVADVGG